MNKIQFKKKKEFMKQNKNPLSSYYFTDKEFEFYEKFHLIVKKSFWKGFLIATILVTAISLVVAIAI